MIKLLLFTIILSLILLIYNVNKTRRIAVGTDTENIIFDNHLGLLLKINLNTFQIEKLSDIPMYRSLRGRYLNLEKIDNDGFLFEYGNKKEIKYYDLKNHSTKLLYANARCPTYFKHNNSILFNKIEKTDSGFQAYIHLGNTNGKNSIRLKEIGLGKTALCPVKINENEAFIFSSKRKNEKEVELFNIKDLSFKRVLLKDGIPKFLLKNGNLLCRNNNTKGYFIGDKNGKKLYDIPFNLMNGYNMFPISYFKEINSILIYEFRERIIQKNVYNLWLLNMDTLDKKLLIKGARTNMKGAIYLSK